jgi:1-acyl-sn-glycerol-3-phosphate acyltransferase
VKPLAGVSLFEHPWVLWWLPPGWSQVLGGIPSETKDFEAAVAQKTTVLYAPEGLRGPGKGFFKRYQLETFHPSFIRLSDRYHIPILPVVCIGNESCILGRLISRNWQNGFTYLFCPSPL